MLTIPAKPVSGPPPLLFPTGNAGAASPRRQVQVEHVLRAMHHIQDHLDEELSLARLAEVAGLSQSTLAHAFPGIVGETVWQLVKRLRLERAAFNLLMSRRPVLDIAVASGFGSQASFTRAFRIAYGTTPGKFRGQVGRGLLPILEAPTGVHVQEAGGLEAFEPIPDLSQSLPVKVLETEPIRLACFRGATGYDDGMAWGWNTIFAWGRQSGRLGERTRYIAMIRQDPYFTPPGRLFCDYCIDVEDGFAGDRLIGTQTLPGGLYATLHVEGPLEHHLRAYNALTYQWLPQSRYSLRGPMRVTDNFLSLEIALSEDVFRPTMDWWHRAVFMQPVEPGQAGELAPI